MNIFYIGIRTYYTYTKSALFQYFTLISETPAYILLSRSACGQHYFDKSNNSSLIYQIQFIKHSYTCVTKIM